jgi:hypothetical protein
MIPPSVGPKIGAKTIVMPVIAKTAPRFSGGKISKIIACCVGCKPPPAAPCNILNTMRLVKDVAAPQAKEAALNRLGSKNPNLLAALKNI